MVGACNNQALLRGNTSQLTVLRAVGFGDMSRRRLEYLSRVPATEDAAVRVVDGVAAEGCELLRPDPTTGFVEMVTFENNPSLSRGVGSGQKLSGVFSKQLVGVDET